VECNIDRRHNLDILLMAELHKDLNKILNPEQLEAGNFEADKVDNNKDWVADIVAKARNKVVGRIVVVADIDNLNKLVVDNSNLEQLC
jgi:hypothetical protein